MFYLTTHSTHFIYGYCFGHMVKDNSDSERGNPLPPHRLLFPISSKVLLYAPSHIQDNTYHGLCYTSRISKQITPLFLILRGARCSSVVNAFAHSAMGRRIDPSAFSRSRQCSTTCVTKAVMCYPVCGMIDIKYHLLLIGKSSPCGDRGFRSRYLTGLLPYLAMFWY